MSFFFFLALTTALAVKNRGFLHQKGGGVPSVPTVHIIPRPSKYFPLHSFCRYQQLQPPNAAPRSFPVYPRNLVYSFFTSGTTGKPKGCMIEHQALVHRIDWFRNTFDLGTADRIPMKTPYVFGVSGAGWIGLGCTHRAGGGLGAVGGGLFGRRKRDAHSRRPDLVLVLDRFTRRQTRDMCRVLFGDLRDSGHAFPGQANFMARALPLLFARIRLAA